MFKCLGVVNGSSPWSGCRVHCRVFVQADYVQIDVKICLSSWCQIDGENALKLKQTEKEYFFTREKNHSQKNENFSDFLVILFLKRFQRFRFQPYPWKFGCFRHDSYAFFWTYITKFKSLNSKDTKSNRTIFSDIFMQTVAARRSKARALFVILIRCKISI